MFAKDDVIDGKYRVDGMCSDSGGMGTILFVTPVSTAREYKIVLKYCKDSDEDQIKRFRREVRLIEGFAGNSRIVQIVDSNINYDPPYFVMRYYPEGDLSKHTDRLHSSLGVQEQMLLQMIDCLQELHSRNEFHRDIKPENFLVDGGQIVVSDFGLSTEVGSRTAFTRSSFYGGTFGFIPPEFLGGGFKYADAAGDIFMLGKTIYTLLSGRDPIYLVADKIPAPLFHIVQRCCSIPKSQRYQTLADLKQSLVSAYDVLTGRADGISRVKQLLSSINERFDHENRYIPDEITEFVDQLALLEETDQITVCDELHQGFFSVLSQQPVIDNLPRFLSIYEKLVEGGQYSWSFATVIANYMRPLFDGKDVPLAQKAHALDLAIRAAFMMNRFAAMDVCIAMITGVSDEELGLEVAALLMKHRDTFIADIEPSQCRSDSIRKALRGIKSTGERTG
jgi:eukaryotic-like serine/threonine-protein kinase